jgi:MFS family permease
MLLGYLLSVTALVTVAGKMGDLFGKSTVIKIGLFIFGLASLLCGYVQQDVFLLLIGISTLPQCR